MRQEREFLGLHSTVTLVKDGKPIFTLCRTAVEVPLFTETTGP